MAYIQANQTIVILSQMKDSPSTEQNLSNMAAIPQFSDEQQAFVVLNYEKYKPSVYKIFVRISQDFAQKFPGSRIPTKVKE